MEWAYHQVKMLSIVYVVFLVVTCVPRFNGERPSSISCQNSDECGQRKCCTINPMRYSTPTCNSLRGVGDSCRPHSVPMNTTLGYPDGSQIELSNVYYVICRCAENLYCDKQSGTCQPQ